MQTQSLIRRAHSRAEDPRQAAREFHAGVAQEHIGLVIFFCSSTYDLEVVAEEMASRFSGIQVIGCTTAGELGPAGYCERSLSGVSLAADACTAFTGLLSGLQRFSMGAGQMFVQNLLEQLQDMAPNAASNNSFAFCMIDGLSRREETVTHALQNALGKIPLIGGSAGDDLRFERTYVYHDGRFHSDSVVMVLATTPLPYSVLKAQHFVPGDERLVVTEAAPSTRVVYEINGLPAAEEYARLTGVSAEQLMPESFANTPVVVLIDGTDYVRSIQKANSDNSLTFYCAIEEGLVLRVARGVDLQNNLESSLASIAASMGPPELILACDCVLRGLEIRRKGWQPEVAKILERYKVVGFNTYGEQHLGVHVNQTFVGLAFGHCAESGDE